MAARFRIGPWQVDPATNRIEGAGGCVHLEPKVMDLLVLLAASPREVVSRERLFAELWPGTFVSDEALTTAVYQLRKALGDRARAPRFVETVPKRGYRLLAPVAPAAAPAVPAPEAVLPASRPWVRWGLAASLVVTVLAGLGARTFRSPAPPSLHAEGAEADALLAARSSLERWGPDGLSTAIAVYEAAVARNPADAAAQAALSAALVRARTWDLLPPERVDSRARAAAAAAVDLAPRLADAHRALGFVRLALDWDFAGAEAGARRALALDPGHAPAHSLLAQVHFIAGRPEEALAAMARAREAAPGSPGIHGLSGALASVLGLPEEAERHYRRALVLDPDDPQLVVALEKLGSSEPAGADPGEPAAREVLDRIARSASYGQVAPSHLASLYAEIGEPGPALEWLDRAWTFRDTGVFDLRYDPRWDPYRDHPRVRALLARLTPS